MNIGMNMKSTKSAAKVAALKPVPKTTQPIPASAATPKPPASVATPKPPVNAATPKPPVNAATPKPPVNAATPKPPANGGVTTIDVKLDVGFGNAVYLRGNGAGLSWERGVPLACVNSATWRWSGEVSDPVTFKLLINDKIWSAGNDLTVAPGQKIEIAPAFV
jgi:hypothetical protein